MITSLSRTSPETKYKSSMIGASSSNLTLTDGSMWGEHVLEIILAAKLKSHSMVRTSTLLKLVKLGLTISMQVSLRNLMMIPTINTHTTTHSS